MTDYDRAYLAGLYRAPGNADADAQQRSIVSSMEHSLGKKDGD